MRYDWFSMGNIDTFSFTKSLHISILTDPILVISIVHKENSIQCISEVDIIIMSLNITGTPNQCM